MRTLKDAAYLNEIVNFKVFWFKEAMIGQKGTPAFKIAMKCKDKDGEDLEGWLNTVIWGTQKSEYFTQKFLDALSVETTITFDGDNPKGLKYSEGKCKLKLNGEWPDVEEWFKHPRHEEQKELNLNSELDNVISSMDDDVIPF